MNAHSRESGNRLGRLKQFISSLSTHLMSRVSHEQTGPRSWPKAHPHQIWLRSVKNRSRESGNKLGRSEQSISSLSAHLTSQVSHKRTRPRSWPKAHPHQVWPRLEMNHTRESGNGLRRSVKLISSLSPHLTSHISPQRTRLRSWPKARPQQVWPRSEKNCTRKSGNGLGRSK